MKIELTISDTKKDRAITALCKNYDYKETIYGKLNSETPEAFSKRMVIQFIKDNVRAYETKVEQAKVIVPESIIIT